MSNVEIKYRGTIEQFAAHLEELATMEIDGAGIESTQKKTAWKHGRADGLKQAAEMLRQFSIEPEALS